MRFAGYGVEEKRLPSTAAMQKVFRALLEHRQNTFETNLKIGVFRLAR